MTEHEALTQRSTISELVRQYQDAEKDVRDGFALVLRGLRALNEFTSFHNLDFECPEEVAIQLRRKTWRTVVARLQMQKAMSVKAWTEFEKKIEGRMAGGKEMYELACASCGRMIGPFQTEGQAESFARVRGWSRDPVTSGRLCQSCGPAEDDEEKQPC